MASQVAPPTSPKIFLVDGYALIYRAFFAMISRPLTTSRGEERAIDQRIAVDEEDLGRGGRSNL